MLDVQGREIEVGDRVRATLQEDSFSMSIEGEVAKISGDILTFETPLGHVNSIRPSTPPLTLRPRLPKHPDAIITFYDPNFLQRKAAMRDAEEGGRWREITGNGFDRFIKPAQMVDVEVIFNPETA